MFARTMIYNALPFLNSWIPLACTSFRNQPLDILKKDLK